MRYRVEILKYPDEIVKTFEPTSKHLAEKCDDGLQHNLNHEEYYTRIVEIEEAHGS